MMLPSSLRREFYERYERSLIEPTWAVDLRHVMMIYELLTSGMFRRALGYTV